MATYMVTYYKPDEPYKVVKVIAADADQAAILTRFWIPGATVVKTKEVSD